jgi:hypothetical protein
MEMNISGGFDEGFAFGFFPLFFSLKSNDVYVRFGSDDCKKEKMKMKFAHIDLLRSEKNPLRLLLVFGFGIFSKFCADYRKRERKKTQKNNPGPRSLPEAFNFLFFIFIFVFSGLPIKMQYDKMIKSPN